MFEHDSEERLSKQAFSRRALVFGGAQALGFSLLGARLFQLQIVDRDRYAPLADDNRMAMLVTAPKRGRILDVTGRPLADNEETFRVTMTPSLAGDTKENLSLLQKLLALSDDSVERILLRIRKQSRSMPVVVASSLPFETIARVGLLAPQLPGVQTEISWRRRYREGASVGHIVGYVGSVDRHALDDDAVLRLPGIKIGKSGIEAGLDDDLRGSGGTQRIEVDARGHVVRNLDQTDAIPGRDITLTIDAALQAVIYERLKLERRAACAVLDISTGEVVAMESAPGYDPSAIVDGLTNDDWQALATSEEKPLLNRAIGGQYPPGSTFKMVTALAAMKSGLFDADEQIACSGRFQLANQTFRCWKRTGHGRMRFHDALRSSCDVYFFELAQRIGINALAAMARELGLGETYACGLLQQRAGLIPDPDWKRGRWNAAWLGGETILAGIGQGYVQTTPLQLAVMTARIASGRAVVPTLVRPGDAAPPVEFARLDISDTALAAVRAAMIGVVNEPGGTGVNARLADGLPLIAGKTGTSQVTRASAETAQEDLDWAERDHALFVAYVPADAPRYACAAIIEHGGGGGVKAAPLVRDILSAVLARDARRQYGPPPPLADVQAGKSAGAASTVRRR